MVITMQMGSAWPRWQVVRDRTLRGSRHLPWRHQVKANASYLQYCHMQGVLQHQGAEALVQSGKSFLRDDGLVAVESSVIARDNRQNFETCVRVVDDCTCPLCTQPAMFI